MEFFKEPFQIVDTILEEAMHGPSGSRQRIMKLFDSIFLLVVENLKAARLMYSIYYGPPQGAPFFDFDGYHLKIREVIRVIVKSGIRKGEIVASDPDIFAYVLMAALNFAMEEQLCHHAPQIDRKGLSRMLDLIFDRRTRTGCRAKARRRKERTKQH